MIRDFERWPKYKELYIRAFQRMIDNHPGQIRMLSEESDAKYGLYDAQREFEAAGILSVDENLMGGGTNSAWQCSTDGSRRRCAEYLLGEWIEYPGGCGAYIQPLA